MVAIDVMRRYLEAVQRGDRGTGCGFLADDGDVGPQEEISGLGSRLAPPEDEVGDWQDPG
jgi:hypothetical protein